MSPRFIFRIDEIGENPKTASLVTQYGHWIPGTHPGDNVHVGGGATNIWWYCNGQNIQALPNNTLPQGSTSYQTFSVFYADGVGFWVLRGDAIRPNRVEPWRPLCFDHDDEDYSSYLTNAGTQPRLRCQRPDQRWPQMLLPNNYHCHPSNTSQKYGGLTGDLAIFLALMALSIDRQYVMQWLPQMFAGGSWRTHVSPHGWVNQRGVVVYVYTCPPSWDANSTADDLKEYEEGDLGKYFN